MKCRTFKLFSVMLSTLLAVSNISAQAQGACDSINNEQLEINYMYRELRRIYPLTVSFAKSCFRSASTDGDRATCIATIGMMSKCDYEDWQSKCGYSTVDFFNRYTIIASRRADLVSLRRKYPSCTLYVFDESAGL
jgi:hypothetical protein